MSRKSFAALAFVAVISAACATPPKSPPPVVNAAATPAPSPALPATREAAQTLAPGVAYWRQTRGGEAPMVAHIVEVDLRRPELSLSVTAADRSAGMEHRALTTSAYLKISGAVVAINASYFLPFAGGSPGGDDFYPKVGDPVNVSGAAVSSGAIVSPVETDLDLRVNAIACFRGAQVLLADGQTCPTRFTDAVAAGPRLIAAGERRSFIAFDNRYASTPHPRTALGVSADGATLWIVVVDGRQAGYSVGATLQELTDLYLALGAREAINLDGGGSTTLVVRDDNGAPRLLNRPIHTGIAGRERPVANHIGLFVAKPPR